jgi:hypothetical protein
MRRPGNTIRLSASVLAHPSRAQRAQRLIDHTPNGGFSLVLDPDPDGPPSALRTALAAWRSIDPEATHHLVVQDDMILSAGLFERAQRAAAAMPDAALSFFALWDSRNGGAVRLGALAGARWVAAGSEYTPSAILLLPRAVAAGFVDFAERRLNTWPDDILMHQYLRATGVASYVAVPNSGEHADVPSISGNRFRGPRKAVCWRAEAPVSHEDSQLTGMSVIPFCKRGKAQCSVRIPGTVPAKWYDIPTERYLASQGLSPSRLRREFTATGECDPLIEWAVWLTGFAMAVVHHLDTGAVASGMGSASPDPAVLTEAIQTIGPGGLCHDTPLPILSQLRETLAETATRGLHAGEEHTSGKHPVGPSTAQTLEIGITGSEPPLMDFLTRGLRDHGWNATQLTAPENSSDLLIDLDVSPTEIGLIWNPRDPHRSRCQFLRTGDLYGPGCSPRSRIGRMVAAAVLGRPIHVDEHPAALLRPMHVEDLVNALHEVLRTRPTNEIMELPRLEPRSISDIAERIRTTVRPVPIEFTTETSTEPIADFHTDVDEEGFVELGFGLHTFAQWLAYETGPESIDSGDPVKSVTTD